MGVGTLRRFVLDVNDLEEGERFWAALTGFEVRMSGWTGRFSALGPPSGHAWLLLQRVAEPKSGDKNRAHLDLTVEDVDAAIGEVLALGGTLKKPNEPYPPDEDPVLDWAVMLDPFGNEFCLIRDVER